jgi:hypothetical protein
MRKFSIDYQGLDNKLTKRAYRLTDVKDRLETVAFDIVRFKDGDEGASLWQIQSADDGDYIVTLYETNEEETVKAASVPWEVVLSKTAKVLNVYYKGDPIVKVAASRLGLPEAEVANVEKYLPAKLAGNKKLVKALLSELDEPTKQAVLNKYPELV